MSERLFRVDCDDLIHALKRAGFVPVRQRGSPLPLKRDADIDPDKFREFLS